MTHEDQEEGIFYQMGRAEVQELFDMNLDDFIHHERSGGAPIEDLRNYIADLKRTRQSNLLESLEGDNSEELKRMFYRGVDDQFVDSVADQIMISAISGNEEMVRELIRWLQWYTIDNPRVPMMTLQDFIGDSESLVTNLKEFFEVMMAHARYISGLLIYYSDDGPVSVERDKTEEALSSTLIEIFKMPDEILGRQPRSAYDVLYTRYMDYIDEYHPIFPRLGMRTYDPSYIMMSSK